MLKKTLLALAVVGAFTFASAQDASAFYRHPVARGVGRVATAPARIVGRRVVYRRAYWGAPTVVVGPAYPYPYYGAGVYVW